MSNYFLELLLETFPPYLESFSQIEDVQAFLFFFVSTQQPRRSHLTRATQQLKDLHGPKDT